MSTVTLSNVRIMSDVRLQVKLKDSGVAVDWSDVTIKSLCMYSEKQKTFAGSCTYTVDSDDPTILHALYPAEEQYYLGKYRLIVSIEYQDDRVTYDAEAFTMVGLTEEVEDETITVEEISVGVEVTSLDTSVLTSILAACQQATDDATTAKNSANTAAANAVAATSAANTAKTNANNAATNANTKATLADQKATLANEKATLANEKASYAETQGNYAKTQGDYAKSQGDYAKTQGNAAKASKESADAATALANTAASSATSAATSANNAASSATSAASAANSAATNANAKVTELNGYASRLQAVEGKTTKISYANSKTTITGNTIVSGTLSVGNEIKANSIGGYDNNSHYLEFGTNESYFFDADGNLADVKVNDILFEGNQSLIEIAQKVNNLVVIDNEEV